VDSQRAGGGAMTAAVATRDAHDRVVRFIAKHRFPFPGQTDWPADNLTLTATNQKDLQVLADICNNWFEALHIQTDCPEESINSTLGVRHLWRLRLARKPISELSCYLRKPDNACGRREL